MKKADMARMIDLQEKLIERLTNQIEALRKERPMLAQGFTSDSVAAQVCTASLHSVWKELGVSSQTECMQKLRELAAAAPGADEDKEQSPPASYVARMRFGSPW